MKTSSFNIAMFVFLLPFLAYAQEPTTLSKDKIIESITESIIQDMDESNDLSNIVDELEELISHPVNINTATREELEKLRILNPAQIGNLLAYRKRTGQLYSLYELPLIDGFSKEIAEKVSLFVTINPPDEKTYNQFRNEINLRTQYTFEKAQGFIANEKGEIRYTGIEPKLYLKYRGEKDNRWHWGLTAENDPGETFFSGPNKSGFDFYTGHLAWTGKKIMKQVIVGDFQVKTGQGLLFWSGFRGFKSVDGSSLRCLGQGIRPYSSSTEYGFFRGIAACAEIGKFNIISFYSNRNADANIASFDEKNQPVTVSSILETGYHRTGNEIADKSSLNIQTVGGSLSFTGKCFSFSVNGGYQYFNLPVEPTEKLYNHYYFRGKENFCLSAEYQRVFGMSSLFGEFAVSKSGGTALIAGIDFSPASEIGFTFLCRDYKKDFHTIGGNPFSEFGTVSNERGFYSGINLFAIPRITLAAYLDLYESYWAKYTSLKPVRGNDFALQAEWSLSKLLNLQIRYKSEICNKNKASQTPVKPDSQETKRHVRISAEWQPSEKLILRFRPEWSSILKEDSVFQGWLLSVDATTSLLKEKLSATARFAWFDSDNYNSGIRSYENDMPQSFNFPAYYMNGLRYYLNISYRITKMLTIYLKMSQTKLFGDSSTMGTGDSQINENHKSEIKFQIRFKF